MLNYINRNQIHYTLYRRLQMSFTSGVQNDMEGIPMRYKPARIGDDSSFMRKNNAEIALQKDMKDNYPARTFTNGGGGASFMQDQTKYNTFRETAQNFKNYDLYDTLTDGALAFILHPPAEYDPQYQRKVNELLLTSVLTVKNIAIDTKYNN